MDQVAVKDVTEEWANHTRAVLQRWFWLPLLVGVALAAAGVVVWREAAPARVAAEFGSLDEVDVAQGRLDTALPVPHGDLMLAQDFVARHDGLQDVEIRLVRYGDEPPVESGVLTLRLVDDAGQVVAEERLEAADYNHNDVYVFAFPRQNDSAGRRYTLEISGNADNPLSVWGYSLNVYDGGALQAQPGALNVETAALDAADLNFRTHYQLTWREAGRALAQTLYFEGALFLLALLFLPLPGCLLLLLWQRRTGLTLIDDPLAWAGVALALGVGTWPLLWLWWSLPGLRWWSWLLWLVVIGGWAAVAVLWWRGRRTAARPLAGLREHFRWEHAALLLILLVGQAARLLAVRDVVFPPWVDSSRHALITAVMAANGRIITDYAPFLPVDRFPYHFGFHTLAASLELMSAWPLPRLLLYLGQLLNGLVPLTMYAAVWLLVRRRGAGLLAAFLVALPFFFPAYYATWGRMTQLTAVLLLPLLLAFTWQVVRGDGPWRSAWWLLGVLAAGLFLLHFRVFLFYLPFAAVVWLVSVARHTRWLAQAAALAGVLVLPRAVQLWQDTNPAQQLGRTIPNYNTFPTSYLSAGWEERFIWVAGAALLLTIIAALWRRPWATLPLALAAWVAALFLLLAEERLGVLPQTSLVNVNSMYIILFVPLGLFLSIVADRVWRWLQGQHWLLQVVGYATAGAALALLFLFGLRQQIGILNQETILAESADLPALQWLEENVPAEATVAVNSWKWLGETWAAGDGGAWIVPLTGRATTTPPIDYVYNPELFREIREFNTAATAVADWSDAAEAAWLRDQGVTHIFVGRRGGFFDPAVLMRNALLTAVYARNGVFIFAIAE